MKKNRVPLGVYIHIPFCEAKCAYCDFLSGPSSNDNKKHYVDALVEQIKEYSYLNEEYDVRTIFIGGGTPSSIDPMDIRRILETVYKIFAMENNHSDNDNKKIEITIEANPGTLTKDKLLIYREAGINRISMGLQSVNDEELKLLGRIHTYKQFEENYHLARECGFTNINIDLMSALPLQTVDTWEHTLKTVIELNPEHISAYSLIIEEGTPFYNRYADGSGLPTEEDDRQMYHLTKKLLREAGYERYEISNYAKPGFESKHNSSYWERIDYIGFGLGASSCLHNTRFHNEEDLALYIEQGTRSQSTDNSLCNQCPNAFDEPDNSYLGRRFEQQELQQLTTKEQMEECMFLGLRMMKGVDINQFEQQFEVRFNDIYGKVAKEMISDGLLLKKDDHLMLTERGIDLSNYVMSEFLL
jgi:oxygen-independent coproporphyrinogen III oxidase